MSLKVLLGEVLLVLVVILGCPSVEVMMEFLLDFQSFQSDKISVDEMVEVECIELADEEDLTTFDIDTAAASNYFGASEEADNYSLFSSKPKDVTCPLYVSSNEEDKPEEASNNLVPSKSQHSSWTKRFRTESAKLEYNRQKASIQRVRRQDLVEGIAKLRAAIGTTEKEFKTCKKLLNHVIESIPQSERQIACQKYRVSCLTQENLILEEKIRALELENPSVHKNTDEQEKCPKKSSHSQSS